MSSTRQPPMGTPQLSTHAGLTPQMSIVDADGRPTMFFFRWLLTIGGAALTASDLEILESFDAGADASLAESAIADALDATGLAAGFEDGGAARADLIARIEELAFAGALRSGAPLPAPTADQRALEALTAAPAAAETIAGDQRFLEALMAAPAPAPDVAAPALVILLDTLANWTTANYNPANYANGQQFLVTTWQVTYTVEAGAWRYTSGTYIALAASRPATGFNGAALGANDAGLRFLASDTLAAFYWNGATWIAWPVVAPSGPAGGDLHGTYPNPLVNTVVNFTPVIQIGGSPTGITFTTTQATSTITGSGTGAVVTVFISITITAWPASPSGSVTILGFPVIPIKASFPATFLPKSGFVGLSTPILAQVTNVPAILLDVQSATGITPLAPTAIAAGAIFTVSATYLSA